MRVVYTAIQTPEGAILAKVAGKRSVSLPAWTNSVSGRVLPWDWASGGYGRWMIAYSILLEATNQGAELADRLVEPFAAHFLRSPLSGGWQLREEDIHLWVTDQICRSVKAGM